MKVEPTSCRTAARNQEMGPSTHTATKWILATLRVALQLMQHAQYIREGVVPQVSAEPSARTNVIDLSIGSTRLRCFGTNRTFARATTLRASVTTNDAQGFHAFCEANWTMLLSDDATRTATSPPTLSKAAQRAQAATQVVKSIQASNRRQAVSALTSTGVAPAWNETAQMMRNLKYLRGGGIGRGQLEKRTRVRPDHCRDVGGNTSQSCPERREGTGGLGSGSTMTHTTKHSQHSATMSWLTQRTLRQSGKYDSLRLRLS